MPRLRLHKSSIVIGLTVILLLVLVMVPGRVADWSPGCFKTFEHGWPFTYLRRKTEQSPNMTTLFASRREAQEKLPMCGVPWWSLANWKFWEAHYRDGKLYRAFDGRTLAVDCALAVLLLVAIVGVYEFRRRRRKSLLRFNLIDVFVIITVACAVLGWVAYLRQGAERETALIAKSDESEEPSVDDVVCVAPTWMTSLIGEKWMPGFTWRVGSMGVRPLDVEDVDQLCTKLRQLPYLSKLSISGFLRDEHFPFANLASLSHLETLRIDTTARLDDHDIQELSQLQALKKIAMMPGNAPERLSRLKVALPGCEITDSDED